MAPMGTELPELEGVGDGGGELKFVIGFVDVGVGVVVGVVLAEFEEEMLDEPLVVDDAAAVDELNVGRVN